MNPALALGILPGLSVYQVMLLAGILVSLLCWRNLAKKDARLLIIYAAALGGAFLGAKLAYLAAEGWNDWHGTDRWLRWATGKSILGALLGGYAAVEWAKRCLSYRRVTGDWFAWIAPLGIILGRIGCLEHGCCPGRACQPAWYAWPDAHGIPRWPAVQVEMAFNLAMLGLFFILRRVKAKTTGEALLAGEQSGTYLLAGQHFHLYLAGYGLFRFMHEFWRESPRILGPFSGYHVIALVVAGWGLYYYLARAREMRQMGLMGQTTSVSSVIS